MTNAPLDVIHHDTIPLTGDVREKLQTWREAEAERPVSIGVCRPTFNRHIVLLCADLVLGNMSDMNCLLLAVPEDR